MGQNIIQQHGIHEDALGNKWREEGLDELACRLIGETCGHLTCLKNENPFFGL